MKKFINNNKLLCILIFFTFISFIIGILSFAFIDDNTKVIISNNINNIINNIRNDNILSFNSFIKLFFSNTILLILIWLFGISIIGIIIVCFLYLFRVYIFGFELISLISILKLNNILFIIIYIIPSFISLFLLFIITFYSISFSLYLFKGLFNKTSIYIRNIIIRYFKVFLLCLIGLFINTLFELYIIPKLILFLF